MRNDKPEGGKSNSDSQWVTSHHPIVHDFPITAQPQVSYSLVTDYLMDLY